VIAISTKKSEKWDLPKDLLTHLGSNGTLWLDYGLIFVEKRT